MSANSAIEWTEHTWNPTTGCTKISDGCQNCYAETMARRLKALGVMGYENGFRLTLHHDRLQNPSKRKKPTMYFVNSMSDLFHEDIPDRYIMKVFSVMKASPQHTFQVLTKRAKRMARLLKHYKVPDNVWIGVTIENKKHGLPRIKELRKLNVHIRFLSMEPLLEDLGELDFTDIQWVIVGGESGPRARPMEPNWVESIKDQCEKQKTAFFFKQWGGWGPDGKKRSKKANGRLLFGRTWDNMPVEYYNSSTDIHRTEIY